MAKIVATGKVDGETVSVHVTDLQGFINSEADALLTAYKMLPDPESPFEDGLSEELCEVRKGDVAWETIETA